MEEDRELRDGYGEIDLELSTESKSHHLAALYDLISDSTIPGHEQHCDLHDSTGWSTCKSGLSAGQRDGI